MQPLYRTRAAATIRSNGITVWLKAEFDVLMRRVKRRPNTDRPMLKGDPAERLKQLMTERAPAYAEADVTVQSRDVPHDTIVDEIVAELVKLLDIPAQKSAVSAAEGQA